MSGGAVNRIDAMFAAKRAAGRRAMIFYLTAGHPSLAATEEAIGALVEAGADLIELGIPFSDPIADGPTIQKSSKAALDGGVKVEDAIELARRARARSETPLIFFSAFNPILHFGLKRFADAAAEVGADGMLVPDLPPEEAGELEALCRARDLKLVFLAAPTTTEARARLIAGHSSGFIYYISLRGVTGARQSLPPDLKEKLEVLRRASDLPLAVGFGIARPEHARLVGAVADGVVVGSALVELIGRAADSPTFKQDIVRFARGLIEALPVDRAPVSST